MSELEEILKNASLGNLISYLIYEAESQGEILENCEEKIEDSYEKIFSGLESMYEEADRDDDQLFSVILDFASVHDDVYFEAGVLIGVQLIKNLEHGYEKYSKETLENILRKSNDLRNRNTEGRNG